MERAGLLTLTFVSIQPKTPQLLSWNCSVAFS